MPSLFFALTIFCLPTTLVFAKNPPKPAATRQAPPADKAAVPAPPLLKAGAVVKLEVKDPAAPTDNWSGCYPVDATGMIAFPGLRPLMAAGSTMEDVMAKTERAYKEFGIASALNFTVTLTESTAPVETPAVFVADAGKFRKIPWQDGTTLYQTIVSAGGLSKFADVSRVKILRDGNETVHTLRFPGSTRPPDLKNGDVIVVPRKSRKPKA